MITDHALRSRIDGTGFDIRGAFTPSADDAGYVPANTRAVVVIGNRGPAMWAHFLPHRGRYPDNALDRWTQEVIKPIAEDLGATAIFPFDTPHPPFQRWAMQAEGLRPSPLGLLIDPHFGLWHAYRAALAFDRMIDRQPTPQSDHPCDDCAEKPCLSACPVGAFSTDGYAVDTCAEHLRTTPRPHCFDGGCNARDACPVGRQHRYPTAQIEFHMRAFRRSVAGV